MAQVHDKGVGIIKQKVLEGERKYKCFHVDHKGILWFESRLVVPKNQVALIHGRERKGKCCVGDFVLHACVFHFVRANKGSSNYITCTKVHLKIVGENMVLLVTCV
jgi:hypothetical protein